MSKIVGIGANVHDTLITINSYPEEDKKFPCKSVKECGGGPCATALTTAATLGSECAYIGALAADASGKFLLADLERFGVSTMFVSVDSEASSFASYILLSLENASRTCVYNKQNLPEFTLDSKKAEAIKNAKIMLVDGNEMENAIKGARIAKESGTKVLYDAGGMYEGVEDLLPFADILIPSEEFALSFTKTKTAKDAAKKLYELFCPEVIVITQGKKGGIILEGGEIREYPSFKVEAIDSNGAGDVFHGAFAFAAEKGFSYYNACVFSSAVSAIKCTKVGARDAVPTYEETVKFLKERGFNEFKEKLEW